MKLTANFLRQVRENMHKILRVLLILFFSMSALTGCIPSKEQSQSNGRLQVVATTSIVGDVVSQIGGDRIDLSVLLPLGTDPHSFDPSPQDVAEIADADLVFANGGGLEAFLDTLIENANAHSKVFNVSEGIDFLAFQGDDHEHDVIEENHHEDIDPHTWTDPNNVMVWVENILQVLVEKDSVNKAYYVENAERYMAELKALDSWIRSRVDEIPSENRKLVTDHALFGYYAEVYGFEQVGALIPGFSTLSEPTARELADIEDSILNLEVKAIFVGRTVNPSLAERVATDTEVRLVFVYTGSLSDIDGEASSYLTYMRYNTNAFVEALK